MDIPIPKNEITVLLGASGVGKTTLIHALQESLDDFSYHAQALTLLDHKNVFYHLTLPFKLRNLEIPYDLCDEILKDVNLTHAKDQRVDRLSQGMKQRLNLAMTLIQTQDAVFLDEPFSAQDPLMRQHLYAVVRKWAKDKTVVVVTHHVNEACFLSSNTLTLAKSRNKVDFEFSKIQEKIPSLQLFESEITQLEEPFVETKSYLWGQLLMVCLMVVIWHVGQKYIPSFLLPSPLDVLDSFAQNYKILSYHFAYTIIPLISGVVFASVLSLTLGLSLYRFPHAINILDPFLVAFQSLPVFLILPLFLFVFGVGLPAKIFAMSLTLFFPCFFGILQGLQATPKAWLLQKKNIRELEFLRYIRLPYALPFIAQGFKLCLIHAPLSVLAVDWVGASSGLGYLIMLSHGQLELPLMFAGLFLVVLLCLILNRISRLIRI